jgi:hypothetical protein
MVKELADVSIVTYLGRVIWKRRWRSWMDRRKDLVREEESKKREEKSIVSRAEV